MKNIHVLPTNKPSRLYINLLDYLSFDSLQLRGSNQNIYITNDENKKIGDYIYDPLSKTVHKVTSETIVTASHKSYYKIILTTDQDLIKYGVQAIDDEFLEWFVKNPSCEEVEVAKTNKLIDNYADKDEDKWEVKYHIYFPKEEPKQETIEEAAEIIISDMGWVWENTESSARMVARHCAKWQQDKSKQKRFIADEVGQFQFSRPKMYSEEEVIDLLYKRSIYQDHFESDAEVREWFEKFKKK